jgi:ABC-2 type transport system permease protein/fluoroquinolone transport system permease protein
MRRFGSLLSQDLVLAWRNGHVAVVVAIALLMIALIIFLPAELSSGPNEYLLDELSGAPVRDALIDLGADVQGLPESRSSFDDLLSANPNATGVIVGGTVDRPEVEIIQRTAMPEESINLLTATLDLVLRSLQVGELPTAPVERLRPQAAVIPLNLSGVPVFLAFEVGILGFLLVAVFVFQEKQEGTVRAYRVTPAGLAAYLASKASVFTILGLVYGVAVVLVGFGAAVNWPVLLGLLVWASLFMTIFGLGFAVWFDNLSHWFFPGLALLVLNMLPFFAYIYPVFNPTWLRFIPSYSLVFALREVLFPTGDAELVRQTLVTGIAWLGGAIVFASASVRARLLKGS